MDKQQAQNIVKDTFENPFDKGRFTRLVKNLLNYIDESKAFHARGDVKEMFKHIIKTYERLGTYTDPNGEKVDIIIAYLQKGHSLDHARVTQRNFAGRYLSDRGEKNAGLFAFVSPGEEDWRFSLVIMDYELVQIKSEKWKGQEKFSQARRRSFLVGKNESSHTAKSSLVDIIADDENNPTLNRLVESFNIETVTKEFFKEYKRLYLDLKESLDEFIKDEPSQKIRKEFESKGIDTVVFCKKLLGQIVFLYFLQKKGWLGAKEKWGDGDKKFLRNLFLECKQKNKNFFNDYLEYLFYDALNNQHRISVDPSIYPKFNCKIPFLNGGLFDSDYDWQATDIKIENELFSNKKSDDEGSGILDIFDLYNFTVKEDEPLEKEVAVDPEMLGKVFENLLEVKDRKSKGTYYTPREIVHYMCQQSLINYLCTELNDGIVAYKKLGEKQLDMFGNKGKKGQLDLMIERKSNPTIPKESIETLIKYGEQVGENEATVEAKGKETDTYFYKLPESIRRNAKLIDEKLANIKVCDPAIGSGAFPVGMMSEIIKTRNVLSAFIKDKDRTIYRFKRECIEKSLYGVDIDPGAVEIAKLRLWLSLVVDEEDIKQIKPLPNLDYKIVCGNSLLGVKKNLFNNQLFLELERLKPLLFNETSPKKKQEYKKQIDELIIQITNGHKEFDFEVYFSEVFHEKKGFDVVIANPPYIRHEAIKPIKPQLSKRFGKFYCGTADIYTYFYKAGIEYLKPSGHLCFIAPNKFMRAGYGKNTRTLLTTEATPRMIVDFCELPVFEAGTDPAVILVEKNKPSKDTKLAAAIIKSADEIERVSEVVDLRGFAMKTVDLSVEGWTLESQSVLSFMEKLRKAGTPLGEYVQGRFYRGILTGLNEAFVIDAEIRDKLIAEDPKSEELIKPWLDGHNILKWKGAWDRRYVLAIASSANRQWPWCDEKSEPIGRKVFQKTYPAVHDHLSQWKDKLQKRDDQGKFWWELRSCSYYDEFEKPKIVFNETSKELHAYVDYAGVNINKTGFIIVSDDNEYLLGILNSKLMDNYYRLNFPAWGDPWKGGRVQFRKDRMVLVPVASATDSQKTPIIKLVESILSAPDSPAVPRLEAEIDYLVYALYSLTEEEIRIVEGSVGK